VNVLAVIHGAEVRAGVFGDVVQAAGHSIEEWSLAWGKPLPRPLERYGAVLVFGGAMHADQDDHHPWLREEHFLLQRLLALRIPVLGVCLGAQLIAKASHAAVFPAPEPEIGWAPVRLTDPAGDDPVFRSLPREFTAFQWHYYSYGIPAGAEELAYSQSCTQAFRLGERVWGIQFHAEVTLEQVEGWATEDQHELLVPKDAFLAETRERIAGWNELGRELCGAFVDVAARESEAGLGTASGA
jgi:GMP synthase (glutamine-hydrolysing)